MKDSWHYLKKNQQQPTLGNVSLQMCLLLLYCRYCPSFFLVSHYRADCVSSCANQINLDAWIICNVGIRELSVKQIFSSRKRHLFWTCTLASTQSLTPHHQGPLLKQAWLMWCLSCALHQMCLYFSVISGGS